jgi:predicted TPR repeat methyltransferase
MRELSDDEIVEEFRHRQYHELAVRSMNTMREVEALTEVEPDRKRIAMGKLAALVATPAKKRASVESHEYP